MAPGREIVAIAELCIYIPTLVATIFVLLRQGLSKQLGWFYLILFVALRISGAGVAISSVKKPGDKNLLIWSLILQSIGISPLLLASLGLMKRVTDKASTHVPSNNHHPVVEALMSFSRILKRLFNLLGKRATAASRRSRLLGLLQIPTIIALVLCLVGGINQTSSNPSDINQGRTLTKAGIIMFVVVYSILCLLAGYTTSEFAKVPRGEKSILIALLAALPLLGVRLLWSVLSNFVHAAIFNTRSETSGHTIARVFMANLEEFFIVIAFTVVGLMVPRYVPNGISGLDGPQKLDRYQPQYDPLTLDNPSHHGEPLSEYRR